MTLERSNVVAGTPKVDAGTEWEPRPPRLAESAQLHGSVSPVAGSHLVQYCEDASSLALAVAQFLADGLNGSDAVIAIATATHRDHFSRRLTDLGIDVGATIRAGRLTLVDAHETLASFMNNGAPDRSLFDATVGNLIATKVIATKTVSLGPTARVRAYAEMVDVLWRDGQQSAAIHLEELWNDLQGRHPFTLLCAHAMAGFYKEPVELHRVCASHSHIVGGNGGTAATDAAQLHPTNPPAQHARRLEQEIARRAELENGLRAALRELRAKEEQLRQSYRQLEFITDALPVLVAFVDVDRRYRFVTAGYERWFGHAKREVIGRHLRDVLGDDAYRGIETRVTRALAGEAVTFDAEVPHREGGVRWIEGTYIPQRDATQKVVGFVALIADVTQRKSLERFRASAAARAERLLKITDGIASAVTAEEVFTALVDRVSDAIGASSAGLWLVDDDAPVARLVKSRGYPAPAKANIETLSLDLSPPVPVTDCIRTGEPIWIPSQATMLERYPHLASVATLGRSYRVACLPLSTPRRLLGTLAVTIEGAQDEAHEEREFMLLVARYATQALERLRLLDAERRSRADADAAAARLGVLSCASRTFAESRLDLKGRLRDVVSELARTLDSCINIALIEADGLIHLTAVQHPSAEAQELLARITPAAPLKVGEGVMGGVAATGESVLLRRIDQSQVATRAPEPYRAFLERHPVYALMGAALRVQGRVIGTVTATRCRPGETYTQDDLRLLEELAERAAAAIENSRLYEESLQGRKRAEQLYRFAQSVVSAERVEDVFDAAIAAIENALGAPRSAVLTYDNQGVMRFRAWRNLSDPYRRAVEGHSPWPRESTKPEPVLVHDAEQEEAMAPYRPLFQREGIGALAFIPLVSRERLLGKFMVYYEQPHVFTEGEIATARAIANHLASVIARFSAIAKLEDTVRQNELFAGVLAHDLRNPLGAMTTAAQLLLRRFEGEKTSGERETKPLSRILASGQRMNTMIEQLLDFTRLRSGGGIPIEPHNTNLADLCGQVVGELEIAHPDWRIERQAVGDPCGSWDSDRVLQVLSNLIANACQHGYADAPVSVHIDGTSERDVKIAVRNRGTIPESLLPHLFDPFRSSRHRRDRSRGLGLGLFIVREIVRGHGGTIDVSSTEADGTCFVIRLPRQSQRRRESELSAPWRSP